MTIRKERTMPCAMSDADLRAAFVAHRDGSGKFTRRMAIAIADMADMKPMSLVWRLEKIGLLKSGSWEWFRDNGGITTDQVEQCRSERRVPVAVGVGI